MKVFITGTSSGIGLELTREYLETGAVVYGLSRNLHKTLTQYAHYHHLYQDLADTGNLKERVEHHLKEVEELDLAILNAGMLPKIQDMKESAVKEIKEVMEVNAWANKLIIDAITDSVPKVHQVVGVSSGASVSGSRGWNAYSLSKAALNMLIKLYAKELPGIHFSAISPGIVDTGMQDVIFSLPDDPRFPAVQRLKKMRSENQMATPREAALLFIEVMGYALQKESGSYLDVRDHRVEQAKG